ncbi:MAG: glycosyltransferase family 4 protein [Candidatus Pacebacteria bacterium]|nr:glycosyltransferase family 4 protein [Candidatus Paceibacterota bacterium]
MKKTQILVSTGIYPPSVGGPATYSKLLFDELPGHDIDVKVVSFDEVRSLPKVIRHIVFFIKVLFRSKGCQIIYAQDTVSVGLPSLLASRIYRKKFWLRVPGDYAWEQSRQRYGIKDSIDDFQLRKYSVRVEFLRSIQNFVANGASQIIVPSEYFKRLVSGWVKNPNKVKRIYNGIFLDEYKKDVNDKNIILSSGRLVPWKGFDVLIEVIAELSREYDLELHIAGDGPDKAALQEKIESMGLSDKVKILGFLDKPEMKRELSRATMYVLNTGFESFSFAVVEAMWFSLPVITTNVGNLSEIVDDGKSGVLVEYNNKTEIVTAIEKVLRGHEYAKSLSINAREKARNFSIDRTLDELTNTINKCVS